MTSQSQNATKIPLLSYVGVLFFLLELGNRQPEVPTLTAVTAGEQQKACLLFCLLRCVPGPASGAITSCWENWQIRPELVPNSHHELGYWELSLLRADPSEISLQILLFLSLLPTLDIFLC